MEKIIVRLSDLCYSLNFNKRINRIPISVLIFLIFALGFLSFDLNGNEEQYMLYAKQFMNPDWISSRYLNEFAGTRLFYQIIIGFALKFFSFEFVLFLFRFILCVLYTIPLTKIYKTLNLESWQILLHLPILYLFNQSMFADSWMFVSVEPKGIAYIFILYGLYCFIVADFRKMILFLILGSYFHVFVGGYAFLFLMATLFLFEQPKQKLYFVKLAAIYILALIPFVFYLKTAIESKVDYTPSVSWIYSYFRTPHHVGLFRDISYFYSKHFYGIVTAIVALFFSLYYSRFVENFKIKRLNNFVFVSLVGVLIFVMVAFFDKEGVLLKYYPFRINTLTTFVITLIIPLFFLSSLKKETADLFKQMIVIISIVILFKMTMSSSLNIYKHFKAVNNELVEVCNYIKNHTAKDAVVLSFLDDLSLNRRMERDRFVVYKFIPADLKAIPEWYERELFKRQIAQDLNYIINKPNNYKIDYLLSKNQINSKFMELIKSNNQYYLYKVNLE